MALPSNRLPLPMVVGVRPRGFQVRVARWSERPRPDRRTSLARLGNGPAGAGPSRSARSIPVGPGVAWCAHRSRCWKVSSGRHGILPAAPVGESGLEQLLGQIGDLGGGPRGPTQSPTVGGCAPHGFGSGAVPGQGEFGALTDLRSG